MKKLWLLVAVLTLGTLAAACGTTEPTEAPVEPTTEAVVMPTTPPEPTEEEVASESGMTMEELEARAVEAIDPSLLDLWTVEYTLPDGTTDSPLDADPADDPYRLAVIGSQVVEADLNGDGNLDRALVLVDLASPDGPTFYVAAVTDQDGQWTNTGVFGLPVGSGVKNVRVVDGNIEVDVWQRNAEGTGWVLQTYILTPVDGGYEAGEPVPAPTEPPAEMPAPPWVGITIAPPSSEVAPGDTVDIFVHATDSPGIVQLDWFLNNERQGDGWTSDVEGGVPWVHHTFTWRQATEGRNYIFVTATDVNDQVGTSEIRRYTVRAAE